MVARPGLIIYSFAPKDISSDPETCQPAHDYLKTLWRNCDALGIADPVAGLDISTEFPTEIDLSNPFFRVIAAKMNLERTKELDYQAFLFEYQDVLGFVATLEMNQPVATINTWKTLLEQWTSKTGVIEIPPGILGEIYLFTALPESDVFPLHSNYSDQLATAISNLGQKVMSAFSDDNNLIWRTTTPYVTDTGYCIWGGEPIHKRRTLALLAPHHRRDDLFKWSVWPDAGFLAPFARYLLHSSKLRYAQQVVESEVPKLRDDSRQLDQTVADIVTLYQRSDSDGMWRQHEIIEAHKNLILEQRKNFALLYGISKLKELSLTTRIAARNVRKLVPPAHPRITVADNNFFARDRARSVWLLEQIQMDLGYLNTLRQRVEAAHEIATLLLGRESQETSRRLKNLILIQGTLIGSLTMGLLMLPAFEVFHEHRMMVWAILLLLMAIVLALPVLFERWHERYTLIDHLAGGVLGAAVFFFFFALSPHLVHPRTVSMFIYVVSALAVCFFGFLLGYLGVGRVEKLKAR
jgi:hypothetical protein